MNQPFAPGPGRPALWAEPAHPHAGSAQPQDTPTRPPQGTVTGPPHGTVTRPPGPAAAPLLALAAQPPGGRLLLAAVVAGALAQSLLVAAPMGLNWTLAGWGALGVVALGIHRRRTARRPGSAGAARQRRVLAGLAAALLAVPVVTDCAWLVVLCMLGVCGLAVLTASDARTWRSVLLAVPMLPMDAVLAVVWAGRGLSRLRPAVPHHAGSWLRALAVSAGAVWLVGALLSSGDDAFAAVIRHVLPRLELLTVPARVVLAAAVALAVGTLLHAAARTDGSLDEPSPGRRRPVREWALPLAAVDGLLIVFLSVQAAVLFGGAQVTHALGTTPAERARQGFWQLSAVTALTLLLLAWSAMRCEPARRRDRRLRDGLAGVLVVASMLLAFSALRRMWLYEQAFGFTVSRVVVSAVELLVVALLALVALARARGVAAMLPRLVAGACAVTLLGLGLARPDAVVAAANVARYERTGQLDVAYLRTLSDDAVPALAGLPEPLRRCALGERRPAADPWYAVNLARSRAATALAAADSGTGPLPVACHPQSREEP